MSSKSSKKTTNTSPKIRPLEPIITRTKSAQQRRQLRNKDKITDKPKLTKPEIKSTKCNKSVIRSKEALLKEPVKSSVEVIEQVEYYPNKLKRKLCTKKIMLKPKHNFKVIAATNKRKLATPKRGLKSPTAKSSPRNRLLSPKRLKQTCSSPELSMQDMVRIMEETRSLSDEDFMEILTCPSPVWWEDPPDGYDEDSLCIRSPEQLPQKSTKETKKRKITKTKPLNKRSNNSINIEQKPEQTILKEIKKDERFVQKKQKLENILGNIKNKTIKPINEVKSNAINEDRIRKVSDSEGDISDLSFNEEEILKNLENMDIPIEKPKTDTLPINIKKEVDDKDIKKEIVDANDVTSKNDNLVSENLSSDIKSEIKEELQCIVDDKSNDTNKVPKFNDLHVKTLNIDNQCNNISNIDTCRSSLSSNKDTKRNQSDCSKTLECIENAEQNTLDVRDAINPNKANNNENISNKKAADLSEYITIYKIIPEKSKKENSPEKELKTTSSSRKPKTDVRGKVNDFFKHCKNNKRVKKSVSPIPAIPLTDVKQEIIDNESSDSKIDLEENNRLNGCDSCAVKTENGIKETCETFEMAPILHCDSCNFLADTKEIYKQHVLSCKDVARISWSHNYLLNQT